MAKKPDSNKTVVKRGPKKPREQEKKKRSSVIKKNGPKKPRKKNVPR